MINKAIALGFLILANIILLVHAVVPHHHHEGTVCFETHDGHSCSNHDRDHGHYHNHNHDHSHNHDHNPDQDTSSCLLKTEALLQKGTQWKDIQCPEFQKIQAYFLPSSFHTLNPDILVSLREIFKHPLPPDLYVSQALASCGLRAPPKV